MEVAWLDQQDVRLAWMGIKIGRQSGWLWSRFTANTIFTAEWRDMVERGQVRGNTTVLLIWSFCVLVKMPGRLCHWSVPENCSRNLVALKALQALQSSSFFLRETSIRVPSLMVRCRLRPWFVVFYCCTINKWDFARVWTAVPQSSRILAERLWRAVFTWGKKKNCV